MRNYNLSEVPTIELAKELVRQFLSLHPETLETDPSRVAYMLNIWVHEYLGEYSICVEGLCSDSHKFLKLETEWSEFNELSKRSNVEV